MFTNYGFLGVEQDASSAEIKQQIQEISKAYDVAKNDREWRMYNRIVHAYLVLRDSASRIQNGNSNQEFKKNYTTVFQLAYDVNLKKELLFKEWIQKSGHQVENIVFKDICFKLDHIAFVDGIGKKMDQFGHEKWNTGLISEIYTEPCKYNCSKDKVWLPFWRGRFEYESGVYYFDMNAQNGDVYMSYPKVWTRSL